jgi:hypothetical protein
MAHGGCPSVKFERIKSWQHLLEPALGQCPLPVPVPCPTPIRKSEISQFKIGIENPGMSRIADSTDVPGCRVGASGSAEDHVG